MVNLDESGESSSIEAGDFRLVFSWTGHRWVHRLESIGSNGSKPRIFAVTLEGDPHRDDPARVISPAYQQLHFQGDGRSIQALLVGQSGPHHFSAVFEFEELDRGEILISVDVADRCRGPIEALAGTYTLDARSDELVDASPSQVAWDFGTARLSFEANSPTRVALAEAGRRATLIQALAGSDEGSATHRFRYTWRWTPGDRS